MNEHCLFGNSVWSVCLFRVTIPNRFFAEWNRSEFWIRAHRAEQNSFLDANCSGGFDRVCAHHEIVEIQLRWGYLVVSNSTNAGS